MTSLFLTTSSFLIADTSRCLAFSAGGRYGGMARLSVNAEARVEKYKTTFPT